MTIFAIDPGTTRSAWLRLTTPLEFGIEDNADMLARLRHANQPEEVVIEKVESFGMAVGAEVFETVYWSGRFHEAFRGAVHRLPRRDVKLHLCGSARAKDANIRQALIDRYGGRDAAIGRKTTPGPLYGIKADIWSALAVAVTWSETR